ncbi:MAG: MATE family efflux transporter [Defluviitaleaceae bacterium]|nr:MATE family efflux transporter [Defluviitaleaceae bacterium]
MPKHKVMKQKAIQIQEAKARKASEQPENEALNKDITAKFLLKFSLPTMISMILMGTFGIVDGLFVSNIIGQEAFAAVNIVFPFLTFALAIGFMLGVGGNALAGKKIGEGKLEEARNVFSLISLVTFIASVVMSSAAVFFPRFVLNVLGANDILFYTALEYMQPIAIALPIIVMSVVFQQFMMTIGKAHISTLVFLIGGLVSLGLNVVFLYILNLGIGFAALATSIGYAVPALVGFVYFIFNRKGSLYFVKPKFNIEILKRSSINGASEFVTMMSTSIMSTFMNNVVMEIGGWEGVAAIGIIFATMNILANIFIGYSSGIMPITSFNYGKDDAERLKKIFNLSLKIVGIISICAVALAWLLTHPFVRIFTGPYVSVYMGGVYTDFPNTVYNLAIQGFRIITSGFIFMGFNTFASIFFTSLNDGKISSLLSVLRTLVFVVGALLILPNMFGMYGVFSSMIVAEALTIIVTATALYRMKPKYKYA